MKKLSLAVLMLMFIFCEAFLFSENNNNISFAPVVSAAEIVQSGSCGDNVTYTLDSEGTLTVSGVGAMTNYSYSSSPWYSSRASIKKVIISDGVTSIGNYVFYNCNSLQNVTIGNSVTSIGDNAFYYCSSLQSVTIPDSVTSIGSSAFDYCRNLQSVTIPDSVTSIGEDAFYCCSSLQSVTIPDSVTSIGSSAFYNCSSLQSVYIENLTKWFDIDFKNDSSNPLSNTADLYLNGEKVTDVTFPAGTTTIGKELRGCTSLVNVTISDSVTSIGSDAFYNCSNLQSVYIENLTKWFDIDFENDSSNPLSNTADLYLKGEKLTDVTFPAGTTEIGTQLRGCTSLVNVTIPDSVTSIGNYAFRSCNKLQTVTIPDSVTSIGDYAFSGCSSLQNVTIGNSVTSIGNYAFQYCSNLQNITIPDTVTTIGDYAFRSCNKLQTVTISDSVTSIGDSAFYECVSLQSITIGNSVTSIGDYAFEGCSSLQSVTIGNGVTTIGKYAFYECSNLQSVTIPDSVTSIGYAAFRSCSSLQSITIPDSVTSIGESAFRGCSSLQSVTIGNGVTTIGNYAFYECSNLQSVTIPNSVTSIGKYAFYGCSSLQSVTIPDSVTSIGEDAFAGCSSLQSVYIEDLTKWFDIGFVYSASNPLYNAADLYLNGEKVTDVTFPAGTTTIGKELRGCTSLVNVTIPDSVTSIRDLAFSRCSSLQNVTIPDSVTSIGDYAFNECISLQSITIGNSVTSIGEFAFDDCNSLRCVIFNGTSEQWSNISIGSYNYSLTNAKRYCLGDGYVADGKNILNQSQTLLLRYYAPEKIYTVPSGVKSIEQNAFYNSKNLSAVILPEGLKNIGSYAFGDGNLASIYIPATVSTIDRYAFHYCSNLSDVYFGGTAEQFNSITIGGFNSYLENATIHYNTKLIEIDGAIYTEDMKTLVAISNRKEGAFTVPSTVTTINAYAFSDCGNITEISIPETVTAIGNSAFRNCDGISEITLPVGITKLNNYVLYDCDNLQSITIPDNVTCIGEYAFYGCENLKTVSFNSALLSVGSYAFYGCKELQKLSLPEKLTAIGSYAFSGCSKLSEIYFPSSLTAIGSYAFSKNSALTYVSLPDSVNSLGTYVFYKCMNLEKICLPEGTLASIPANAFNGCSKLTSIFIPEYITAFGDSAFYGCNNLSDIYYGDTEAEWDKISIVSSNSVIWAANVHFEHSHTNSNWQTMIEPEAHKTGLKSSICDVCSYEKREVVPITHTEISIDAINPTCSAIGYTAGVYCNDCEKYISGHREIPALGHVYGEWQIETEPTCTEVGKEIQYCIQGIVQSQLVDSSEYPYPESAHNYSNNVNETYSFRVEGATELQVTFNKNTKFESNYDYLYIYDAAGTQIGRYTGTSLAGQTITIPSGSMTLKLTSDGSNTAYGFKIDSIYTIINNSLGFEYSCDSYNEREIAALGHDEVNHAAKAPTCTEIGWDAYETCSRCDYTTYAEKSALGHDEVNHDAKAPTCTEIGWDTYETCSRCDYTTYVEKAINADAHMWDNGTITTTATCKMNGVKAYTCEYNSKHTYTEDLGLDASNHVNTINTDAIAPTCSAVGFTAGVYCNDCEKYISGHEKIAIETDAHKWDNGTITTIATCKVSGVKTYTCQHDATHKKTENLGVNASDHINTKNTEAVASTCSTVGYTAGVWCNDCEKYISGHAEITIDANAHNWDNGTITTTATCKVSGVKTYICQHNSEHTKTVNLGVNISNHVNTKNVAEVKATCTTKGFTAGVYCNDCQKYVSGHAEIPVDTNAHKWDNGTITTTATCEVNGVKTYTCEYNSEHTYTEDLGLNASNHINTMNTEAITPTCSEVGYTAGVYCNDCQKYISGHTEIDAKGHTSVTDKAVAATCTTAGKTEGSHCSVCNTVIIAQKNVPATGHKWDNGKATTAATCKAKGVKTYTCQNDASHKKTEDIAVNASNHVNTKNVPATPATYDAIGYTEGVYCNDCQKYISGHTEIPKLVPEFTDSKDAKESGNNIISNNGLTIAQLLSQAGKGATIKTKDGKAVENAALIGTGMVLTMADGSKKEIVVYGDVDGDGKISAADARLALRASVGLEKYSEGSCYYKAANVESKDKLSAADARLILRASVGLEDPKSWLK